MQGISRIDKIPPAFASAYYCLALLNELMIDNAPIGGVGTMTGSLLGVVLIAMIGNGLILLHLDPFYVPVVQGAILLAALWLHARVAGKRDAT